MCRALPVLRTFTRATTADLSQLGLGPGGLRHTSVGSELDTLPDLEDEAELSGSFSTPTTPAPPATTQHTPPLPLERATSTPAESTAATAQPAPVTPTVAALAPEPLALVAPLALTPTLTTIPQATSAILTSTPTDTAKDAERLESSPAGVVLTKSAAAREAPNTSDIPAQPATTAGETKPDAAAKQLAEAEAKAEAILSALRSGLLARGGPALLAPLMVAAASGASSASGATTNGCHLFDLPGAGGDSGCVPGDGPGGGSSTLQREQSTLSSNSESSESTLEGDEDPQGDDDTQDQDEDSDGEHQEHQQEQQEQQQEQQPEPDEPRFTVAQLITAYNLHDEVVTKSSLDFTMAATDREAKLPPVLNNSKSKFPTGPNALRLFIPDIDITNAKPRKSKSRKSSLDTFALHASKIVEEDAEQTGTEISDRLSADTINNNIHHTSHSDSKLIIRVDDMSSPRFSRSESLSSETSGGTCGTGTSTRTVSSEELQATVPPPQGPPQAPPPPFAIEPKKSPKPGRPSLGPSPSPSVQRHRRSASTPNSEAHSPRESRVAGLSPSPSTSRSASAHTANGINRSGSGAGSSRKSGSGAPSVNASERLRRKSTPVFK